MLETLRRIVQAVNTASNQEEALSLAVSRVKGAMAVEVCSVYLSTGDGYVLRATDGLNADAVGRVHLSREEGLVGLVGTRQEPVNLDNAAAHPRFRYFPETGEERYQSFLGVPIIHYRRELGVLVVQAADHRLFDADEVAFLVTIAAQLAGAITHAAASADTGAPAVAGVARSTFLQGVRGAPGVAMGTIAQLHPLADLPTVPDRAVADVEVEVLAFRGAVTAVQAELQAGGERMAGLLPAEARALFDFYVMLLGSESLVADTVRRIREGSWAPAALRDTIAEQARVFDDMEDAYLRARAEDIRDVGRRILQRLQSEAAQTRDYPENCILMGDVVSVAQIAEVPVQRIAGIVCTRGSAASHIAVLAHALGIPAVMGLGDLLVGRIDGRPIVVDGYEGRIAIDPPPSVRTEFRRLVAQERELSAGLEELRGLPAETLDGLRLPLYVNTGLLSDISPALRSGAEGVGLYRTEFPFMIRQSFPGEEEQYGQYRQVLESFAGRPVTMRTLDVGGDKSLPYFPVVEDNPFLGWRGIRFTLDHPEIFLSQLRAMLRANAGLGSLRLLLPMVSNLDEIDESLALLGRACEELMEEGHDPQRPPVGVMVEVPSLVYQAAAAARKVDFLSIGTNDLTQYMLAVDRNNARVAALYDSLHPAVLAAVNDVVGRAHEQGKPVSVCGEMAGDPGSAILLLGMGVDSLSMSASMISRVKWVVRSVTLERARTLLAEALTLEAPHAIRALLDRELELAGLGSLVRAGK